MKVSSLSRLAAYGSGLMLFLSLLPIWPGVYYLLLGYVVGVTAVLMVVRAEELKKPKWIWTWIAVAILFNPIAPLRMPYSIQLAVNLLTGALFLIASRTLRL